MKEIEAAYRMKKPGKFMAMVMSALTGEECTPTNLGEFEEKYPNEFKEMKHILDIDFPREVKNYNNGFGVTGNPIDEFAKYLWTRVSEHKEDFDLVFPKNGKSLEIETGTLQLIQVAAIQVIDLKESAQDESNKKNAQALYTSFVNCSISFDEFVRKAHALNEKENKVRNPNLVPDVNSKMQDADQTYRQTSENEAGWENLKKNCLYERKYGYTVYEIQNQEDLAAVADNEGWCVAHKGESGKRFFYQTYGGGPYYLICIGDEKPFILMHPRSGQFKTSHNDDPFKNRSYLDRPSRTSIFEYAKEILEATKDKSGWNGTYYKDFRLLENPESVSAPEYDFAEIIASKNCPADLLSEALKSTDENVIIDVVKSSNVPYENLYKLAEAAHPKKDINILTTIAMSPLLDDKLADLLLLKNKYTSINIAKNDKCSPAIMKKIIVGKYDGSGTAMVALLGKPYCTDKLIEKYIERPEFYQSEEMYRTILTNQKLSTALLLKVMDKVNKMPEGTPKINITELCYKHPSLPKSYLTDTIKKVDKLKKEYDEVHKNEEHPTPYRLSPEDEKELILTLRNPNCSADMLAQVTNMFYKNPNHSKILLAVAENPSTPERSLLKISEKIRKNIDVAIALVNNKNCPFNALMASAKLLDEALDNKSNRTELMNAILRNQYCTDKMKDELIYRKTFENIRDTIFPEKMLYELSFDEDIDIAYISRMQLKKVHGKTVEDNGNIYDMNGNLVYQYKPKKALSQAKASSKKYDRIVASVVESEIALKITKSY